MERSLANCCSPILTPWPGGLFAQVHRQIWGVLAFPRTTETQATSTPHEMGRHWLELFERSLEFLKGLSAGVHTDVTSLHFKMLAGTP